jgi:hypothetical protein
VSPERIRRGAFRYSLGQYFYFVYSRLSVCRADIILHPEHRAHGMSRQQILKRIVSGRCAREYSDL